MTAIELGRLCVKIAGRDAGKECVIVDVQDKNFVLIDGNTRRRKCNIAHLQLLSQKADIKKGATHEEAIATLEKFGIKKETKAPAKAPKPKPSAPEEKKLLKVPKLKKEAKKKEEKKV